jgi:hypothetical protein
MRPRPWFPYVLVLLFPLLLLATTDAQAKKFLSGTISTAVPTLTNGNGF